MGAHRSIIVHVHANNGDADFSSVAEIEFRGSVGGADLVPVQTGDVGLPIIASSYWHDSFSGPRRAFNDATDAAVSDSGFASDWWIGVDWGPNPADWKDIREVAIMRQYGAVGVSRAPLNFDIKVTDTDPLDSPTWVVALEVTGATSWTEGVFNAYEVPATPTGVIITPGTRQNVITWVDNATDEVAYHVYGSLVFGFTPSSATLLATLPPNSTTYTHGPVSPNEVWYYLVAAVFANGSMLFSTTAFGSSLSSASVCALRCRWFPHVSRDDTSRVEVAGVPVATGPFTAMCWVAWTTFAAAAHILGKFGNWRIWADSQLAGTVWRANFGEVQAVISGVHVPREPFGTALVFDGAVLTIYIYNPADDVLHSASQALGGPIQSDQDNPFVVANHYAGGWTHNGYIWDVRYFLEAKSPAQLRELFAAPIDDRSWGTPLVALPMGEGEPEPNFGSIASSGIVHGLTALGVRPR